MTFLASFRPANGGERYAYHPTASQAWEILLGFRTWGEAPGERRSNLWDVLDVLASCPDVTGSISDGLGTYSVSVAPAPRVSSQAGLATFRGGTL